MVFPNGCFYTCIHLKGTHKECMELSSVLQKIDKAYGLGNEHYISPLIYAQEKSSLFANNWIAIGFSHDVPEAGDVYPVNFMDMPLLMVRQKNGQITVFQNTCRHRGMILVDRPTHLQGLIRCPYHSWCYNLEGALVRTPHIGGVGTDDHPAIDCKTLGLFAFSTYVWQGVVFVNMSADAPAFDESHADLCNRWREFNQPYFLGGPESTFSMTVQCNWKLAIENYCEAYHLPWVHPELSHISRLEDHTHIADHSDYAGQISLVYQQLTGEDGQRFPDFAELDDRWQQRGEYIALFPNLLLGVHRDHVLAMVLIPQGPEQTLERITLSYASKDVTQTQWQAMRQRNAQFWKNVFNEDVHVIQGMQKGRHGPLFDGGKFSPVMDISTHIFHQWVAHQMLG